MKSLLKPVWPALACGLLAYIALPAGVAVAQEGADEVIIEEIITTGTRRAQRTAADSAVPIDVISGDEFVNQGTPDVDDMLRTTLPSYNVQRHAIDDAATLVRPATLRGLPPDNTLVLVNGKRRHRSGVIAELGGSLAAGSQGPDLASIPPMAIKQLEVLRDGASAQYGSDAIAGVLNFVLRDDADGFSAEARFGEYMEGDGTLTQFAANAGFPLGNDGFANVTFQWREQDPTSRSTQRTDAATLIAQGAPEQQANVRQPFAQIWGAPEFRDDFNVFINSGIQLNSSQEIYAFGNIGGRETEGGFFYRNPNSRGGVFTFDNDDVTYRAIVDTTLQGIESGIVSNCPLLESPGSGSGGSLDPAAVAADSAARAALPGNCFVANQLLPGGYTPQFGGKLSDASGVVGLRGELANGLSYDFSGAIGRNEVEFFLANTWNPSLGPDGVIQGELQRAFDTGAYVQTETNFNVDFVYPIAVDAFASDLSLAFGAEWRDEQFEIRIGEVNSWDAGRFAFQSGTDPSQPNCYPDPLNPGMTYPDNCARNSQGEIIPLANLSIGSHGFAGFSPNQAGVFGRSNTAVYVEGDADIVENFNLVAAVRFEDFEDFGTTTNGKLAARLQLTDTFALRGSVSTGFRAPTPGQSNVTKVSTTTIDGELQQRGQIPPTNPIATFLGGQALEPEDATNFTFGAVWDVSDTFNVTVDLFQIEVEDRITLTGEKVIADRDVPADLAAQCPLATNLAQCLQEIGIPGAADLNSVAFFTNDFATTTTGVDLVATWDVDWGNAGSGNLTAAWNYTETEIDAAGEELSRNRLVDLENFNPKNRGVFTYNHTVGNWRFLARASFYDDWISGDFSDDPGFVDPADPDWNRNNPVFSIDCTIPNDKCYDGEWLFDIEGAYTFTDRWTIIAGAQNVFDEFGPVDQDNLDGTIGSGNTFDNSIPWGMDGGFWYIRLRADFE